MVVAKVHGGRCCGARHLEGFDAATEANPDLILEQQRTVDRFRMTEVILNGTQIESRPRSLRRLADLGYVFVGHYINGNHMSHNYVFHRCDNRLPLVNDDGSCVIPGWDGPVLTPRLQGELPALPAATTRVDTARDVRYCRPELVRGAGTEGFVVGARVRYHTGPSRHHGMLGTLSRTGARDGHGPTWHIRWDGVGYEQGACRQEFLELLAPVEARVITPAVGQRVVWNGVRAIPENGSRENRRPVGSLGAITRITNSNQHPGVTSLYVIWDNPTDTESNVVYYYGNQLTILSEAEARDNPVVVIPVEVVPEFVATRHAVAGDWEAYRTAVGLPVIPEAPPLPRIVCITFHNVYRDGRFGAGYDTYAAARAARRGDGRIDRRDVYSNGTIQVQEDCAPF